MNNQQRQALIEERFFHIYGAEPAIWVQAPGRVDLMGTHTDYNLGYVLIQAINRNICIAAKPRTDSKVRIASLNLDGMAEFDLRNIEHSKDVTWSNYVRGVADVLQKEKYELNGFDGLIHSTIPFGSGLSSSAALEVATIVVFECMTNWQIDPLQKALLCQKAENEFVGMNCGIMDQYSSVMGKEGCILLLDCRSLTSEIKPVSPGVQVMICDTRAERALTGSEYPQRRAQCEAGVRLMAGYGSNIKSLRDISNEQIQAYKEDMDPVIYKRCTFIIEENQRVLDLAEALKTGDHQKAGQLAIESFQGARDKYEIVSQEMIDMYESIMSAPGIFGARGAGAGFGGCLVSFIDSELGSPFTDHVYKDYLARTGIKPEIYPVSASDGAGVLVPLEVS